MARKPAAARGGIFGVGVDLLKLERMGTAYARHGQRIIDRLLGEAEQAQLRKRLQRRRSRGAGVAQRSEAAIAARFLAMAFATKEAAVKALGTGFHGVGYRDFQMVHEASGKPTLAFSAAMQKRLKKLGIRGGHVSLTDEGGMICAFVVLERA